MRILDCFTMIFVDCDDTLIPSKIHRYLCKNLAIDIFTLYQRTMLKQFQYDIIYAIEKIKEVFDQQYNEEIKIAVVSNASSKWLNHTINNKNDNAQFQLLCDYFTDNDICVKSAIDETFNFLCKKFGDKNKEKVNQMIAMSLNANNPHHSKWMLKYTTYSSIINHYKRKLSKKCRKIVNIGDGETELEAIKHYSQTFGVDYIALKFIKNATFNQLSYQWKYIRNNFWSIISDMDVNHSYNQPLYDVDDDEEEEDMKEPLNYKNITEYNYGNTRQRYKSMVVNNAANNKKEFKHKRSSSNLSQSSCSTTESHAMLNVFYFDYVLKNDNNPHFTGNNQLTAIRTYFEKWVRIYVLSKKTKEDKDNMLKWMCTKIHAKMRGNDPYSQGMISFKLSICDCDCINLLITL